MEFRGFNEKSILFLKDLSANNTKKWVEQNRHIYEEHLLTPLRQLTMSLSNVVADIDPEIDTTPAINKTISKIYRDTRFSKDKSPLRTDQWISFRRPSKIWGNVPEFYFYFTPFEYQMGMGFYSATPANMQKIREHIEVFPARFKDILDYYQSQNTFVLVGDEYKTIKPNNLAKEYQVWFKKKNLCMSCEKSMDESFFSSDLQYKIAEAFTANADLYLFLIDSIFKG